LAEAAKAWSQPARDAPYSAALPQVVRHFLIELHKAAISRNISREDCRNPSHGSFRRWKITFATAYRMNSTARSVAVAHWQIQSTDLPQWL
jgi:hypothetical protein